MTSSKRPKWAFLNILYRITHETYGVGVKFGPPERYLFGDPRFLCIFLKGDIIVHEIKINS